MAGKKASCPCLFRGGGNPSKYALGENETRTGKQRVTENIRTDWFFEGDITIMPRGKSLRTDRRRGMKKKYKYFLIGVLSTMFLFVGCNPFAIKPWERKKLYEYYSDNANYIRVKGKITYRIFTKQCELSSRSQYSAHCLELS